MVGKLTEMNGLTRWGVAQLCDLGGSYLASFSIALFILGGLMSTIAPRLLLGGPSVIDVILH